MRSDTAYPGSWTGYIERNVMKQLIENKVEELLSGQFCLRKACLRGNQTVFTVKADAKKPYLKILAYKNCVAVCSSEELSGRLRWLLQGKSRDEIFELPFVYGQTIHYVPDYGHCQYASVHFRYRCDVLLDEEILALQGLTGFDNSLVFEEDGSTVARAVCIAGDGKDIIGIAGASGTSVDSFWEVGVDVREKYRGEGVGTYLVSRLTNELTERDIVPFYSASVTNIGSQRTAHRSGYIPMWVDTFGTILDGSSVYDDIVGRIKY